MTVLGVSVAALHLLLSHVDARSTYGAPLDYLLALIAFVAASSGSAMLVLGGHLFDEVEISLRWRG